MKTETLDFLSLPKNPTWKTFLLNAIKFKKLDPWKVDISELADAYLEEIKKAKEKGFAIGGNAILVCAILLYFKAKLLFPKKEEKKAKEKEISEDFEDINEMEDEDVEVVYRKIKKRKVSINELISLLEELFEKKEKKKEKKAFVLKNVVSSLFFISMLKTYFQKNKKKTFDLLFILQDLNIFKEEEIISLFISLLVLASRNEVLLEEEKNNIKIKVV